MKITDETLIEYLAGNLSGEEQSEIVQAAAGDSELEARLEELAPVVQFLATGDDTSVRLDPSQIAEIEKRAVEKISLSTDLPNWGGRLLRMGLLISVIPITVWVVTLAINPARQTTMRQAPPATDRLQAGSSSPAPTKHGQSARIASPDLLESVPAQPASSAVDTAGMIPPPPGSSVGQTVVQPPQIQAAEGEQADRPRTFFSNGVQLELSQIFQTFATLGEFNVLVSPTVRGKMALDLRDVTPVDGLQLVAKIHGLDVKEIQATDRRRTFAIAPSDVIQRGFEQANAETVRIRYARAEDFANLIRESIDKESGLSVRTDKRTNSEILNGTREVIQNAHRKLDRPLEPPRVLAMNGTTSSLNVGSRTIFTDQGGLKRQDSPPKDRGSPPSASASVSTQDWYGESQGSNRGAQVDHDTVSGSDLSGYDREGFDRQGFNRHGFDRNGYDVRGLDRYGRARVGISAEGRTADGYDRGGFDRSGFNRQGYDRKGYNRAGFDIDGYDRDGFDREGYDREGFDRRGINRAGVDRSGKSPGPSLPENPFVPVRLQPESTFSIDVDTASYANVRRIIRSGLRPRPQDVRIEELINAFEYTVPAPEGGEPLTATVEIAGCPWNPENRLARIVLRGKDVDPLEQVPRNLVFLIDVSGSMADADKLPLLVRGLEYLIETLTSDDSVAIVVYAGESGVALPRTPGNKREDIKAALHDLVAKGSTNGEAGIKHAYEMASRGFIEGGINRVILATDGDFNVGLTDDDDLVRLIEQEAQRGVFLTVLGLGSHSVRDTTMEQLADRGNGVYAFLDSFAEAKKVLFHQATKTLVTVAKDVKLQVEFNPTRVSQYRLIGYENRSLHTEDFEDDAKDAGELGAGDTVTALYELVLASENALDPSPQNRRYQTTAALTNEAHSSEILNVKLRYKLPAGSKSVAVSFPATDTGKTFVRASEDFRFAASVAAFGMILRGSQFSGDSTLEWVRDEVGRLIRPGVHSEREEFWDLVTKAIPLVR